MLQVWKRSKLVNALMNYIEIKSLCLIMKPVSAEFALFHLLFQRNHTEQTTEALTCFELQIKQQPLFLSSQQQLWNKGKTGTARLHPPAAVQWHPTTVFSCGNNTTAIVCLHFAMKYRQTKQQCTVYCEVLQEKLTFLSLLNVFIYTILHGSVHDSTALSTEVINKLRVSLLVK